MANYYKQKVNLPTREDPKSQHFVKDVYDEQRLLKFLDDESISFTDVVIIDPYWELDSMKIVHNIIVRINSNSIFRNLIVLKCKKQNDNNDTSKIERYIDVNKHELENVRIIDTQAKDSFHNRYLIFGYIEKEQEETKKMVSERVFVLSDSLCSITKPAKAENFSDRRRELDIAYQSDFESVRKTVEGLFEIYVGNKI